MSTDAISSSSAASSVAALRLQATQRAPDTDGDEATESGAQKAAEAASSSASPAPKSANLGQNLNTTA